MDILEKRFTPHNLQRRLTVTKDGYNEPYHSARTGRMKRKEYLFPTLLLFCSQFTTLVVHMSAHERDRKPLTSTG